MGELGSDYRETEGFNNEGKKLRAKEGLIAFAYIETLLAGDTSPHAKIVIDILDEEREARLAELDENDRDAVIESANDWLEENPSKTSKEE
jgi:hypothetical protein